MFIKSKTALSLALIAATASTAMAAPKQVARHHAAAARQIPARALLSFGSAPAARRVAQPTYMTIQDIGFKENLGD